MSRSITEFVEDWREESANTAQIMDALTDTSLAQAVAKDDRTLGRVAWHIVTAIPEMLGHTGLHATSVDAQAPLPSHAADIAAAYKAVANEIVELIQRDWTDATLAVEDNMYGMTWARGLTLEILIRHEIHHRGQMTVLMRQASLRVPGTCGPAREDWAGMGQPIPEI
jgi:uncharacterized damage-inducible protein DinB